MIKLRAVPTPILFGATIVSLSVCAFALRANNQHMLELRQAVYSADEQGGNVQAALVGLQSYVIAHMNTSLDSDSSGVYPPVQLKFTYDRLVQARSEKLATTNAQTYNEAQKFCEQQNPNDFSGRNRVPCIEQYVEKAGLTLPPIPDALYKFSFASPAWSPDLAGWSAVTSVVLALSTVVTAARRFIKR